MPTIFQHLSYHLWRWLESAWPQIWSFLQPLFIAWMVQEWSDRNARGNNISTGNLVEEVMARNRHQYQPKTL